MFSFARALKQLTNKKQCLLQTDARQSRIIELPTLENLMGLAKHLPKYSQRVLWIIPTFDITQNFVESSPERQRIWADVWGIRNYPCLPKRIAYVRILAGPQNILVLTHPRNDHTDSETSGIPLGFFIFSALETQGVKLRIGDLPQ